MLYETKERVIPHLSKKQVQEANFHYSVSADQAGAAPGSLMNCECSQRITSSGVVLFLLPNHLLPVQDLSGLRV